MNLKSVKVGDTLIWNNQGIEDSREVKVTRLTKTQVFASGNKFRKSNGQVVGSLYWDSPSLTIPKEGEIEKIREASLHRQLVLEINTACLNSQLRAMPLEKLQQLKQKRAKLLQGQTVEIYRLALEQERENSVKRLDIGRKELAENEKLLALLEQEFKQLEKQQNTLHLEAKEASSHLKEELESRAWTEKQLELLLSHSEK